jgi:hypothetical protein
MIQRTNDFKKLLVVNVGVAGGGLQIGVTEKLFDGQQINALLKQVCCKGVSQRVNSGRLVYAGFFLAR